MADDVTLRYNYDAAGQVTGVAALIGSTADYVNTYTYDPLRRITRITQSGAIGGNPVAEKRVDFTYDAFGRPDTQTRYADLDGTELVAGWRGSRMPRARRYSRTTTLPSCQ